jgi:uncharacterized membrane protein YGL010W
LVAVVVTSVAPLPWRDVLYVVVVIAAVVFVLSNLPRGSWKRWGQDVGVVVVTLGWIVGFAGVALARHRKSAAHKRQPSDT